MKNIYIHAGLHKTGTSALQLALYQNQNDLLEQGFYYPKIGIPPKYHGHHNIAWQFSRDRRFRPEFGDMNSLLAEIGRAKTNTVILSSEDFESSLLRPHRMQKISSCFLKNQIKVCFVIYLRSQIDYIQSLYFELLKWGYGDEFHAFMRRASMLNRVEYKEWEFIFNYAELRKSLQSIADIEVIFRDYDDLIGKNTVSDFCNVVGIDCQKPSFIENTDKINERLISSSLLKLFIRNRLGALPGSVVGVVDELFVDEFGPLVLSTGAQKRFQRLSEETALDRNKIAIHRQAGVSSGLMIEKVFSFETCGLVLNLMKLNQEPARRKQLIAEWRVWVKLDT
jgi:hypothetical protein